MKKRIFTLMMAFLAIAGNAVWGQTYGTQESPVEINISYMYEGKDAPQGDGYNATKSTITDIHTEGAYSNTLTITAGGYYKLTGTESNIQITVSATNPVHITFASGINVDASLDNTIKDPDNGGKGIWSDRCAMEILSGAHVTLDWEGNANSRVELSSGGDRAGINVKPQATLVLKGTHEAALWGTSWNNQDGVYTSGAGIGGDSENPDFGTIIIESGTVVGRCFAQVPNWRAYGAGIGGGFKVTNKNQNPAEGISSKAGTIIIKDGNVTGTANYAHPEGVFNTTGICAAIGGSYAGTCSNIAILGGTVNATTGTDLDADAIGVGANYKINNEKGGISKGIVIGKWDEKANEPTISVAENNINGKNIVWGEKSLLKGNVTMPAETQMYTTQTVASTNPDEKFYSYRLNLSESSIADSEDGDHQSTYYEATKNIGNYYLGAKRPFDLPKLSCDKNHIFMGWIKPGETDATFVALNNGKCSMVTPETDATKMDESLMYSPVWVDNDKNILVVSGTNWDEKDTPEISVVPNNALDKLAFSFKNVISDEELKGITFKDNKLYFLSYNLHFILLYFICIPILL